MALASDESSKDRRGSQLPSSVADRAGAAVAASFAAPRLVTGNAGDHKPIYALLRAANQAPSYEDFTTWFDEPTYEPADRLLVKFDSRIIAHVLVLSRLAWFHGVRLPVGGIQDLAALPEHREVGYERLLLTAAEQTIRGHGAVAAFARTERPEIFRAAGWSDVHGQRFTEANVSDILALLASAGTRPSRRARSLRVRLWRHVELQGLRDVYRTATAAAWGAIDRSEHYWQWLVGRKAHDELIVAVHGNDDWEELDRPAHIVGYAATRGSQVVELSMLPGYAKAAGRILARACQDAIEQDHRTLSLHTPACDPLHHLMLAAGGGWALDGRISKGTLMIRLLDPPRWIDAINPVLQRRAKAGGVKRPCQITFDTGRGSLRLELTRRSSRLVPVDDAPAAVRCDHDTLASLLLGNLDVRVARQAGQLVVSDDTTANNLAALFPPATFGQSHFDTLRF